MLDMLSGFVAGQDDGEWVSSPDPWRREVGKIRWKILVPLKGRVSADLSLGLAEMEPGGRIVLHHHPAAEIYYCLSGTGLVQISGEDHQVGPGDTVFIPKGAEHRMDNTGQELLRFLFVFPGDSHVDIPYSYLESGPI